jgi:hypothetical protein
LDSLFDNRIKEERKMETYENIPYDVDIILQLQMEQEWGK